MLDYVDQSTTLMPNAPNAGDEGLIVRFFRKARQDQNMTAEFGRAMFRDVDYVSIRAPGDKTLELVRPASDHDKRRFRRQWDAFKSGDGAALVGTPLREWAMMPASKVEELASLGIHTLEQVAGLSDGNIPPGGDIASWKVKAKDAIELAKSNAPLEQLKARLEKRDEEFTALKRQLDELAATRAMETGAPPPSTVALPWPAPPSTVAKRK